LPNFTHLDQHRAGMKNEHPIDLATSAERLAAAEWETLLGRLRAVPETRVQRLREAIASGDFQVDAGKIAERLIRRLLAS
jgi:flagellar biosynthesis anti-sigma factor FlgM